MERIYKIAGKRLKVTCADELAFAQAGPMEVFETKSEKWDYQMHLELVEELALPEGELVYQDSSKAVYRTPMGQIRYKGTVSESLEGAYLRWNRCGNESNVQLKESKYCESIRHKVILDAMEAEHLIAENDGILLHASYICHKGQAVLFTAPSGVGKSTQASLWEKYCGAVVVNGDRAAIISEKDKILAYGIPFSGSSGICKNITAPVQAIIYLEQSADNEVISLKGKDAFRAIWEGCTVNIWDGEDVEKSMRTVGKIIHHIPVFKMKCRADKGAVETLKKYL